MVSTLQVMYSLSYYENSVKEKIYFQKGCVMKRVMKVVKFYGGDGCVGHSQVELVEVVESSRISRIPQVDGSKK